VSFVSAIRDILGIRKDKIETEKASLEVEKLKKTTSGSRISH